MHTSTTPDAALMRQVGDMLLHDLWTFQEAANSARKGFLFIENEGNLASRSVSASLSLAAAAGRLAEMCMIVSPVPISHLPPYPVCRQVYPVIVPQPEMFNVWLLKCDRLAKYMQCGLKRDLNGCRLGSLAMSRRLLRFIPWCEYTRSR